MFMSADVAKVTAILQPLGHAGWPVADAHELRALPHVEGVFALGVDVSLDRRSGGVVFAREVEQDTGNPFVVGRAEQKQWWRIARYPRGDAERPGIDEDLEIRS